MAGVSMRLHAPAKRCEWNSIVGNIRWRGCRALLHQVRVFAAIALSACVAIARVAWADESVPAKPTEEGWRAKFVDPTDGKFDASTFLESAYGFVPIGSIITDPAVGYGGALGLIFVQPTGESSPTGKGPPNLSVAGVLATENGTWGAAVGDSRNWRAGTMKTLAGAAYASANLEFFGLDD